MILYGGNFFSVVSFWHYGDMDIFISLICEGENSVMFLLLYEHTRRRSISMFLNVLRIILVIFSGAALIQSINASIRASREDRKGLRSTLIIAVLFVIEVCFLVIFIINPHEMRQNIDVLIWILTALIGYLYLNRKRSSTNNRQGDNVRD